MFKKQLRVNKDFRFKKFMEDVSFQIIDRVLGSLDIEKGFGSLCYTALHQKD